jgi:hypothetical protein
MRKLLWLIFLSGLFLQMSAYDRKSLVERFTNASCAPCASINNSWYNATTANLLSTESISHIVYNGWWPGSGDPMYVLNQADNTARINYYGVNSVPWIVVNGSTISTSQTALINSVNTGNSQYSPFQISITQNALSSNLIELNVVVTRDPQDTTTFGPLKLRVALTEKTVSFASPPGSNGETEFFSVCRKMMPNALGTDFVIPDPGQSTEVLLQYTPTTQFNNSVIFDSLRVVAFIQSDQNKYTYQSYMMDLIPNFVANITTANPDLMTLNNSLIEFTTSVMNEGFSDDMYYVNASIDGADGWTGEFTTTNGTFAFGETDSLQVSVNNSADVSVQVNPNGTDGFATINIQFSSANDPGVIVTETVRAVTTTGVDMLVIDASGEGYAELAENSIDKFYDGSLGIVTREALESPDADLSSFYLVAWIAGDALPVFNTDDVTLLETFLDDGGRLFITGQDIGKDIMDASGQSQFAQSFYNNYLHANYVADFGGSFFITGVSGDPIGSGQAFAINSIYTRSPDQISPFNSDATPVLQFGGGPNRVAIKAESGDFRVVYFALGLEQIDSETIRDTLVSRTVAWLMDGVVVGVHEDESATANTFSLDQNYPNPFNPSTSIAYSIKQESQVSLKIYDIMGAEVAELVNTRQPAGNYSIQFDASNLSSGVYLYRISAGSFVSVKKMTLLK